MKKKIFVTGATGFVGTYLIDALLSAGSSVTAIYHSKHMKDESFSHNANINWIYGDIVHGSFEKELIGIDTVYHLAGSFSPGYSNSTLQQLLEINCDGTRNIANAAVATGVKRFILISSVAACEDSNNLIIDECNGKPKSAYGISKIMAEEALQQVADNKMSYISLRPTALFGEGHLGSIYELAKAIKQHKFFIIGNGKNHVNFQYIRDFIDILICIKGSKIIIDGTYVVADKSITLEELVHIISKNLHIYTKQAYVPFIAGYLAGFMLDVMGKTIRKQMPLSVNRVKAMTQDILYSTDKLEQYITLDFKYGVHKGLVKTLNWYQSQEIL